MASSSNPPEVTKPSSPEVSLRVASCNLRADLNLNKFDSSLHIMIEFLKSHPIHKPLTKSTEFPLSIIHMAYSTAVYNSKEEYIEFDVQEDKTKKLCKNEFLKIIGLPESKKEKTFYEPTNEELFDVLDEMGYLPPRLEKPTNFKKGKLPAMWQFLVHIILRCLTGKVGGMDQMNRPFLVLLFGIYTGKEVDFGTTIWKDFASYISPKKKEIPCVRFWGLVLQKGYKKLGLTKLKVPLPEGEEMFTPRVFSKYNISDKSDFAKGTRLPEAMLQYIDENSEVLIKHREDTSPPEPIRPTRIGLIGDTSNPRCKKQNGLKEKKTPGRGTKRKGETISSPQGKKQLTQTILNFPKINDVEKSPTAVESESHKEEMVRTGAKLLEQAMSSFVFLTKEVREELKKKAVEKEKQKREKEEMVDGASEAMEEDFVFTADEGLIRDSVSPKSVKVKPSEFKIFLLTSDTESEHVKQVPKGKSKILPTTSTSRRRTKVKKKNPSYVSRVEFDSLNQKLSEVLDAVKKIPPSEENFVSKEDFVEMKKIVTSLAQSIPSLETREKDLRESIVKSTADALREMEDKRTDDTFKYLNRMDEMVKMVKEIQQSYEDLTTTLGEKHRNEIVRINEQLCDYRNKNIILQAVLVKVIQSAQQVQRPRKVKFDEVLCAIEKVQNSVDALPNTLSNDELTKQAQQSFSKLFELIQDLKGPRSVDKDEGGPSTKVGEDEKVVINETSNEPEQPPNIAISHTKDEIPSEEEQCDLTASVDAIRQIRDDELVPKQTFSCPSSYEYQLDIPMSPNARYYPVFQPLNSHLEKLFKTHAQPSNNVWSLRRIVRVLGYKKMLFKEKEFFSFKVVRSDNKEYDFSEADFPNMNPNDLYLIGRHFQNTLLTHGSSKSPFVRIKIFLRSLIYDLWSIDAERFEGFVNDPPREIDQDLEGIEERHRGPTEDPELGIIYSNERDSPRLFFRLRQKHLCKTEFLEEMIGLTLRSRKASEGLKGKIVEEIEWWVAVRKWIKKVMNLVMTEI